MKRNNVFNVIPLLAMLCLLYSCGAATSSKPASNLEEAKKAIAASNDIYFQAFVKGDSSLFINRYAEDCCIMPPDASPFCVVVCHSAYI